MTVVLIVGLAAFGIIMLCVALLVSRHRDDE